MLACHIGKGEESGERGWCWVLRREVAEMASYSDQDARGSSNRESYLLAAHCCCALLLLRDLLLWSLGTTVRYTGS